jgi:hypothetical protein
MATGEMTTAARYTGTVRKATPQNAEDDSTTQRMIHTHRARNLVHKSRKVAPFTPADSLTTN